MASLGFDLDRAVDDGMLVLDHVELLGAAVDTGGEWDLEGLFLRLGSAIDRVGAKRCSIDTIENLFGAFTDATVVRSELRRLFAWLKDRGVTAVITAERGEGSLTRFGIEEYVSDCVIVLDHRVNAQASTRRLRVLKYRGSHHGTDEYPFLIGADGISVMPLTPFSLRHGVNSERMSTGIGRLDAMLGAGGFPRGSTVLVNGAPGTGKSTIAAQFCDATCARGERAMYFSFDQSEAEIIRSMAAVGIDLQRWVDADLLRFRCLRPTLLGLEAHLFDVQQLTGEFEPAVVVKDPISDLLRLGTATDVSAMLTRQVDLLKSNGITTVFTSLDSGTEVSGDDGLLGSLADTQISLRMVEGNGEFNRVLYVRKSRGAAHSNQIREFMLTDRGVEIADVYVGPQGVLTGSARQAQEALERLEGAARLQKLDERRIDLERRREAVEERTATLWREFADESDAVQRLLTEASTGVDVRADQRVEQGRLRQADEDGQGRPGDGADRDAAGDA